MRQRFSSHHQDMQGVLCFARCGRAASNSLHGSWCAQLTAGICICKCSAEHDGKAVILTEVCPEIERLLWQVQDLRDSVRALKQDPNCVKDGKAPVYGMANINPDRSMVGEILVAVQDNLLD